MIKPGEINSISGKAGVRDTQIEKDYVISWILYGISHNAYLKEHLVFKGGTVLKKVYFPNYRFSEDLDFTFVGDFNIETVKASFVTLIRQVHEASRITLTLKSETQHDTGNFNFYISYTGPLGGVGANKDIKVDITQDEHICNPPEEKNIISPYSDLQQETYGLLCYSLGEVIAEKMRSLMQRTQPRDIYDLWYLFEMDGNNIEDHIFDFQVKAKYKKLDPNKLVSVIEQKGTTFASHWRDHLTNQMIAVPDFGETWRKLGKYWRRFERFIE